MNETSFATFQRLTWKSGISRVVGAVPMGSEEEDALGALLALGGLACVQCGKALQEANAYVCCSRLHCPYCGSWVGGGGCRHHVSSLWGETLSESAEWRHLLQLTPPAGRLRSHAKSGYPRWSAEQWRAAYSPDVLPHLQALFGEALRDLNLDRLRAWLTRACVQPDLKLTVGYTNGFTRSEYFTADPNAALARVTNLLSAVAEGTRQLRAMTPREFGHTAPKRPW